MKWLGLFIFLFLLGCTPSTQEKWDVPELPHHFPEFPEHLIPLQAEVSLGKDLFFDELLSGNRGISCGSCHLPELAFTDGKPISMGVKGAMGFRNSPSLLNVVYKPMYFAEGGVFPLERTINPPLETDFEMAHNMGLLIEDLRESDYSKRFENIYDKEVQPRHVVRVLASYMRTLLSYNSKFDQYIQGSYSLTPQEQQGLKLFTSDQLNCEKCHHLPMTTSYFFAVNKFDYDSEEPGRYRLTLLESDWKKFMIPSLRNVEITAPYFHNGGAKTLSEVLDHYQKVDSLTLNEETFAIREINQEEKEQLIAFLKTLTDDKYKGKK